MNVKNEMFQMAKDLFPIARSLTGQGVRQTLHQIKNKIGDLQIHSLSSGTEVFDWTVPKEWHVSEAYIITPDGKKICDVKSNNLHLVGYSVPVNKKLTLDELQKHLYSIPEQPTAIPYVTSYYKQNWGFCLSHTERENLQNGYYKVVINSKLFNGELNYGDLLIKGKTKKEILLSTYICHPSMANNEVSGPVVTTFLAEWLSKNKNLQHNYRIVFVPETIGSIAYLSQHLEHLKKYVFAGFNITCVGDNLGNSFLPSRNGNTTADKVARHVLKWMAPGYREYSWLDRGSDERQYCSPGIDLPVVSIMKSKYGEYDEYHTSLDNLDFISPEGLSNSFEIMKTVLETLEHLQYFQATVLGEPQLGKRGLYPDISRKGSVAEAKLLIDFLTYCDGNDDLVDIAEKLRMPAWELIPIVKILEENELVQRV